MNHKPMTEEERCITPKCGKERKWKGLCQSCYGVARNLVDRGETSWDELGELGLALIDVKPFLAAFRAKKGQTENTLNQRIQNQLPTEENG